MYDFGHLDRGGPSWVLGKNLPMKWPFLTLAGYVGYSTACGLNESIGKYVLEEPSLRILAARRHGVELPGRHT